jgi:hypothetical protein
VEMVCLTLIPDTTSGNTEDGPGECYTARAEVVEIVLYFCRPILPESPFDATRRAPTTSGGGTERNYRGDCSTIP